MDSSVIDSQQQPRHGGIGESFPGSRQTPEGGQVTSDNDQGTEADAVCIPECTPKLRVQYNSNGRWGR